MAENINTMRGVFFRKNIKDNKDIFLWWNKGRKWVNILFLCSVIIHLSILVFILHDGWILFLLPIILFLAIIVNFTFSAGFFIELFMNKFVKKKIDFDKISPIIKILSYLVIMLGVIILSYCNIIDFL